MKNKLMMGATLLPATLLLQATPSLADTGSYEWGPGMMWGGSQWGGFGFFLGPVFMVLILIAIIGGVLYLVRGFSAPAHAAPRDPAGDALAILNERFARGEIDEKEYQDRKKVLLNH